jgi:hypothetical protein
MRKILVLMSVLLHASAFAQFVTHGMTIPAGHPRLFWNSTRLSAAQVWLAANPFTAATNQDIAFQSYVNGSSCTTAVNNATSWLVPYSQWNTSANGSDSYRTETENFLLVFDWCYSSFSTASLGTTTLSTSIVAGQAVSMTVAATTGMFVGEVLTLGGTGTENVIVDQVTDSTHVRVQNVVNAHTNGITITLMNKKDSFANKVVIWAKSIQQQSWGGSASGGQISNNYYWGNMRNEFEIGVVSYGDVATDPDNLIDDSLTTRWTNQIVAGAVANGSLSGGIPQEGMEYGAAQFQYWLIPMLSAANMGRSLSTESPYFKELAFWALYSTSPAKTYIKDFGGLVQYFMNTWSDDEITASGGGILWARGYITDGMNVLSQLYSSINAGKYARQYLNSFPTVAPLALDPYSSSTRNYYVSNFITSADPGVSALAYTSLPLDYYATGYQAGIWKTAWNSSASYVFYQFSKPTGAGHSHNDFGNADIWRNGRYLSRKTISYGNTIAGEPNINANANQSNDTVSNLYNNVLGFTNVALGQDSNASYMMPTITAGSPVVSRLESVTGYGYVAADTSNTYLWDPGHSSFNTGVVGSVIREMIWIRSLETLVVFDRVVTAAQTHGGSLTASQVVTTAFHHYEVSPTQDGGGSDYQHWTSTNGTQVMRQTVLIPAGLTSSNARLINEASCVGCDAVGQFRLDIDNSGAATRYHLSVLQARDTGGTNHTATVVDSNAGSPTTGTFTITITPSAGSATTIVFNKGASSSGGTIAIAGGIAGNLRSDVQGITYTDNGPVWAGSTTSTPLTFQGITAKGITVP